jgi:hypothetical protein
VIGNGRIAVEGLAAEKFVAAGRAAVKLKAKSPKLSDDVAISKSGKRPKSDYAATTMV